MSAKNSACVYGAGERDELSGRLKASRQRVAELEKNLGSAVNNNQKQEKVHAVYFWL